MSRARNPLQEFTPNSQGTIAKLVTREQLIAPTSFADQQSIIGTGAPGDPLRTPGGGSAPNTYEGRAFSWVDDWFIGAQLAQGNGWNGAPIGTPPYSIFLNGANTAITPVTGHQRIGVVSLDTGTTAAGLAAIATQASLAWDSGTFTDITFEAVVGFQNLSTVADEYVAEVGLVGNAPGYRVAFRYDRVNGGDFWMAVTEEAGVETATVLDGSGGTLACPLVDVVFPNTGMQQVKVVYGFNGTELLAARFYVNGQLAFTQTLTLPSHSLAGSVGITKSAGLNVRRMYLDYTALGCALNATRLP